MKTEKVILRPRDEFEEVVRVPFAKGVSFEGRFQKVYKKASEGRAIINDVLMSCEVKDSDLLKRMFIFVEN